MGCGMLKSQNKLIKKHSTDDPPIPADPITDPSTDTQQQLLPNPRFVVRRLSKVTNFYSLSVKITDGLYGDIRVATYLPTSQRRLLKCINKNRFKSPAEISRFLTELDLYKTFDHPNIVRVFEYFEDETQYFIAREFLAGGELFEYVLSQQCLSEPIAANFIKQVLGALVYVHEKGIVHRDLRPENIMLDKEGDDAVIKVIGFENAADASMSQGLSKGASLIYTAPEVLKGGKYSEKSDMWSLGVIVYILVSGRDPFYGNTEADLKQRIASCKLSFASHEWENVSSECKNLIRTLLKSNPVSRPSASEVLSNPWFKKNEQKTEFSRKNTLGLNNLRTFYTTKKMQYIFLSYIANHLLTNSESYKLHNKFKELDKNNDGKISRDELIQAYSAVMNKEDALNEARKAMEIADEDGSGFIDYAEFITACAKREVLLCKKNLENTFKAFDLDENGIISGEELKEMLGKIGADDGVVEKLIAQVDLNSDGGIDFEEFKTLMQGCFVMAQMCD